MRDDGVCSIDESTSSARQCGRITIGWGSQRVGQHAIPLRLAGRARFDGPHRRYDSDGDGL